MPASPVDTQDERLQRRREQVREAQRRRRERLAQGQRTPIEIFLSKDAQARLDALALLWGATRQEVIERLLVQVQIDASVALDEPEWTTAEDGGSTPKITK